MAGRLTVIGTTGNDYLMGSVNLYLDGIKVASVGGTRVSIPISKACTLSCAYRNRSGVNSVQLDTDFQTTVKIEILEPGTLSNPARIGLAIVEQVPINEKLYDVCKNANIQNIHAEEALDQLKAVAKDAGFDCSDEDLIQVCTQIRKETPVANDTPTEDESNTEEDEIKVPGKLVVLNHDVSNKVELYLDGSHIGTLKKKEKLSVPITKTGTLSCKILGTFRDISGNSELKIKTGYISLVKVEWLVHILSPNELTMNLLKELSLKEKLYLDCKEAGIASADSRANIAKIKLIAENMGLTCEETDLLELFNQAKEDDARKAKAEETRAAEQRKREQESEAEKAVEESKRYVNYVGREKLVQMCFDEAAKYRTIEMKCIEDENYIRNAGDSLYQSSKQKEHDWATHGGIASGIAGGAAGLATAMNIQQKNADIRARNDSLGYAIAGMQVQASAKVRERKKEAIKNAEIWEERVKNAKQRLVENLPEDDLLARLSPSFVKMSPSEIGTIDIEVTISSTPGLVIYDTVPAVVDGHIKAVFWNNDTRVGEAVLSLPYQGAIRNTTLKSVFLPKDKATTNYSVTFEPIDLWVIETPDTVR
ncbi:MAG: hypothetical protein IKY34_04565 [Ruminiclostridium sp.]|nr:hypothetical protein [Ruminiclostridium sp.]